MRSFGRLLQKVGLCLPPVAIVLQLAEVLSLGQMLIMTVASFCLFYNGRLAEGYSGS
jgi:hypothetical protein